MKVNDFKYKGFKSNIKLENINFQRIIINKYLLDCTMDFKYGIYLEIKTIIYLNFSFFFKEQHYIVVNLKNITLVIDKDFAFPKQINLDALP